MREGLAYFIAEPPEYEAHGDHIVAKRGGMEFFMPIWVAQEIVRELERALADWRVEQSGKVEPIRHAASS
jgi:hypothetical protein